MCKKDLKMYNDFLSKHQIKYKEYKKIDEHFNDWRSNLNKIFRSFDINDFKLSKLLQLTNSVIAGGSILNAFTSFTEPEDYTGDIDIFINYYSKDNNKTEIMYDLALENWGYTVFDGWSKYNKPEECPVCYTSDHSFQLLQPCEHWLCEECLFKILSTNNKRCPTCRSKLWSKFSLFHSEKELKDLKELGKSGYDEIVKIRHFKVYTKGNKTIQLIYIDNVMLNIKRFDLSFCQIYFNGLNLYCIYPEQTLLKEGFLIHPNKLTEKQKKRIQKYSERGFKITTIHYNHLTELIDIIPIEDDIKKYILKSYI